MVGLAIIVEGGVIAFGAALCLPYSAGLKGQSQVWLPAVSSSENSTRMSASSNDYLSFTKRRFPSPIPRLKAAMNGKGAHLSRGGEVARTKGVLFMLTSDSEDKSPPSDLADVICLWAELGRKAFQAKDRWKVDWRPVWELIELANEKLAVESARLKRLLEKSGDKLAPFSDPLAVDFGTHRWLKKQREESYSDWLHWVVEQLRPESVIKLFGLTRLFPLEVQQIENLQNLSFEVYREYSIPREYDSRGGRIDLLIRFRNHVGQAAALLAVEAKVGSADDADTKKQERYRLSLERENQRNFRILLAESGEKPEYDGGFKLLTWAEVCLELRRLSPTFVQDKRYVVASMVLAFVGAVEQNLLDYPTRVAKTAAHLENYLAMKG